MDMKPLKTIVYLSTASRLMLTADLERLLMQAQRLNQASSVSGVLLYSDGLFMQCIEGEPDAVDRTYERILCSRGHQKFHELVHEEVTERSFADWTMGFARPTTSKLLQLANAPWHQKLGCESATLGFLLLRGFWHANQAASPNTDWRLHGSAGREPTPTSADC